MKTPYSVKITITGVQNLPCTQGYEIGDSWIVDEPTLPNDMCSNAWDMLNRPVMAMCYGLEHPFLHMKDNTIVMSCPDHYCKVIYEAKVIGKNPGATGSCD